jgi:hypothetical protein
MRKTLVPLILVLSACTQNFKATIAPIANESEKISCPQAYEVSMDYFISTIEAKNDMQKLDIESFKSNLKFSDQDAQEEFYHIYSDFFDRLIKLSGEEKNENLIELATQLKVEDSDTDSRKQLVQETKSKIQVLSQKLKSKGVECSALKPPTPGKGEPPKWDPQPSPQPNDPGNTPADKSDIKKAMEKVFAVTYQSCEVLQQKPLTAEVPPIEGIKEDCCHPDGRGKLRTISDLKAVLKTHYYLQAPLSGSQCYNIRGNPLIYDYGGRPNYSKGSEGKLNFFKNLGGTKVLGYDCSALVYSVLLGGGFRLIPNKPFVASDVVAAQSRQFVSPESKGWSCLQRITMTPAKTIEVGDIVSFDGHVVMIYSRGEDPFGLNKIYNCNEVSINDFDFRVFQSSPSKDGIGVNVYEAKDYLKEGDKMAEIFLDYAKNACLSKTQGKDIQLKRTDYSITRHKNTSECRTQSVSFENEACVVGTCI